MQPGKIICANNTTGILVKAGPVRLFALDIGNVASGARFVKFYDKATVPVPGTDTPVWTVDLAATSARAVPLPPTGVAFLLGMGIGITAAMADSDTTAPSAGDVVVNYATR